MVRFNGKRVRNFFKINVSQTYRTLKIQTSERYPVVAFRAIKTLYIEYWFTARGGGGARRSQNLICFMFGRISIRLLENSISQQHFTLQGAVKIELKALAFSFSKRVCKHLKTVSKSANFHIQHLTIVKPCYSCMLLFKGQVTRFYSPYIMNLPKFRAFCQIIKQTCVLRVFATFLLLN